MVRNYQVIIPYECVVRWSLRVRFEAVNFNGSLRAVSLDCQIAAFKMFVLVFKVLFVKKLSNYLAVSRQ